MSGVPDFTTFGGVLFWLGIVVAIAAGVLFVVLWKNRPVAKGAGVTVLIGVVVALIGVAAINLTPAPATVAPSVPGASANVVVKSTNFVGGETWTPATNTVSLTLVYNSTSGAVYLAPKLGFTGSGTAATEACGSSTACPNYVVIPMKLARTDVINATAGFTMSFNGPTLLTSTGSNPTQYSPIGYTAASSTSGGVWKISWSAGSLSGINPSQNAPSVNTGIAPNVVGAPAFGSVTSAASFSLAGGNSTTGTWGTLATNFTSYSSTFQFSGGSGVTPSTITVTWLLLGWTK